MFSNNIYTYRLTQQNSWSFDMRLFLRYVSGQTYRHADRNILHPFPEGQKIKRVITTDSVPYFGDFDITQFWECRQPASSSSVRSNWRWIGVVRCHIHVCRIAKELAVRELREKWKLLNLRLKLTLTLTQEINNHLRTRTRVCEIAHALWRGCELFGTTPASGYIAHGRPIYQCTCIWMTWWMLQSWAGEK